MTIETTYAPDRYVGDGVQVDFSITFTFVAAADIRATITEGGVNTSLDNGTDFTVSGTTLTVAEAVADGAQITIHMEMDNTQATVYRNTGTLDLNNIEDDFDRAALELQILAEQMDRSVKVPVTSTVHPDDLLAELSEDVAAASVAAGAAAGSATAASGSAASAANSAAASASSASEAQAARDALLPAAGDFLTTDDIGDTVEARDPDIIKSDQTANLTVGYTADYKTMNATAPSFATGAVQVLDTSGGDVALNPPTDTGLMRFVITGGNNVLISASYDFNDGDTYDPVNGFAICEMGNTGTKTYVSIRNLTT